MLLRYFSMSAEQDEAHHDLDAGEPASALGELFQVLRERGEEEEGRRRGMKAKLTIPGYGLRPFDWTEETSSGPTKGPTQAKEVRAKVRPMSNVPT